MSNNKPNNSILDGLVRYGTVTAVSGTKVRVFFPDQNLSSGLLPCLQHKGTTLTDSDDTLDEWKPEVGQKVVCLYLPVDNGDGFVLGVVE